MSTGFINTRDNASQPRKARSDAPILDSRIVAAMALLCVSVLAIVTFGRLTGVGVQHVPRAPVVDARELLFADIGKGVIEIRDAEGGALLQRIGTNEGSFLRVVMRGFAQDRLKAGGDRATPFRLTHHANGHMIMADPVTGREVLLDPFGKPARDTFGPLLKGGGAAAAPSAVRAAGTVQPQRDVK
jgi:putative photosynthetic complex assembly protein